MFSMYNPMMYGMMGMNYGMMGMNTGGNRAEYYHQTYGCGPEDFGSRPYAKRCAIGITPIVPDKNREHGVRRFMLDLLA